MEGFTHVQFQRRKTLHLTSATSNEIIQLLIFFLKRVNLLTFLNTLNITTYHINLILKSSNETFHTWFLRVSDLSRGSTIFSLYDCFYVSPSRGLVVLSSEDLLFFPGEFLTRFCFAIYWSCFVESWGGHAECQIKWVKFELLNCTSFLQWVTHVQISYKIQWHLVYII